ncbi:oxygenase MpaB family protein [Rhodococcus sp. ARC_M6]|uniref:oxygenase MpaB family protein n=1 Tax=Rhodococcus sp. ARC_M6 TaxID=2928852 RepID=UPI001FB3CBEC|nr:oxygenase MpaB family protein [Rhodococcus sp. ARC_M6]MCJ0902843.1 oxygenase MpaB family protein [Rhodococcus sp. ARC_M6]
MTSDADTRSQRPESHELRAAPIGPGSLTWKHFGDIRGLLYLGRAGSLQNMHPAVSGALQDHSNFFEDPLDRLFRSLPPIYGVIYDQHDRRTGTVVRDFHKDLKGIDETGQRYHALAPDIFWWTHVTFFEVILDFNERFAYKKFTSAQKDQVVREAVTWWRCYGLTDRPAFDDYASFRTYWENMLDNQLINTYTTQWSSRISEHRIAPAPGVPPWLWKIIGRPTTVAGNWLAKALMPEKARETLEWEWTARDQRIYTWFTRAMTTTDRFWHLLPPRLRYAPRAYAGMRKQGR